MLATILNPPGHINVLLTRGLDIAFYNVVKGFKDQGACDQDLEQIESLDVEDQAGWAKIGSDKLGWLKFDVKALLALLPVQP